MYLFLYDMNKILINDRDDASLLLNCGHAPSDIFKLIET